MGRLEVGAQAGGEAVGVELAPRWREGGEGLATDARDEIASPVEVHPDSVRHTAATRDWYRGGVANVMYIDFDGAIVRNNLPEAIFERFAAAGWERERDAFVAGKKSIEQYHRAALDLVDASLDALTAYAREVAVVRPGLLDVLDWAAWNGWAAVILSDGFEFCVEAVLGILGADRVARHAGRARFDYRWRVTYLSPRGLEVQDGFKASYVSASHQAGDFVVYAGADAGAVTAVASADAVFATGELSTALSGAGGRVYAFETFGDVVAVLEREAESWLESFSSTTAGEA